jgi:protein-disulfide isomerase
MSRVCRSFFTAVCLLFLAGLAIPIHAQTPASKENNLTPDLAWRVEVLFRSKATLPPAAEVHIGPRTPSEISGYDKIAITYTAAGQTSAPIPFLLSHDGKSLVQFNKFDITADPRTIVSAGNRPARGGPENAPVTIVVFDDLECPFCARLNATLFPAVLDRYKDQVRIVYLDFPNEGHPWALRAAIDVNCLAEQSGRGYWNAVDTIHARAAELGGPERSLAKANTSLDEIVSQSGEQQHVDATALKACIQKQDSSTIERSREQGLALLVQVTPTFFINGARVEGAVPIDLIFHMIDSALLAEGKTPPPPPPVQQGQ